ncbi:MAG: hypothetical protein GY821_06985 [Gammaproteobacteria bacterium]|nr:hypothetical protein [Gammaproteobacteria bacterium]
MRQALTKLPLSSLVNRFSSAYCGLLPLNSVPCLASHIIRTDQKDFNYRSIRSELKKVNQLTALYQASQTWLPSLQLSDNAVRYCAMLTEQYNASRLRKLSQSQQSSRVGPHGTDPLTPRYVRCRIPRFQTGV